MEIKEMKIKILGIKDAHLAEGIVVVIDVLRAYTTASYAFYRGAKQLYLVKDIKDAFVLKKRHEDVLLMGEDHAYPLEGFDFGNSPVEISKQDLKGKTLVFRSTAGTKGAVLSSHADRILTGSFTVAEATLKRIQNLNPDTVSLLITSEINSDEDVSFAEYMKARLENRNIDPLHYVKRIKYSEGAKAFMQDPHPKLNKEDIDYACKLDYFPFAMEVFKEKQLLILRAISPEGGIWASL